MNMKSLLSILVMGVVYVSILLVCEIGLGLNGRQTFGIFIVSAVIIFAGSELYKRIYSAVYIKKICKLLLLFDERKFDECIDKLNAIEKTTKSRHVKNMAKLNIAFAFMWKKDYVEAKYILECFGRSLESMTEVEMARRLNLCLCYFLDLFMYIVFNKNIIEARKRLREARLLCQDEEFKADFDCMESIINFSNSV